MFQYRNCTSAAECYLGSQHKCSNYPRTGKKQTNKKSKKQTNNKNTNKLKKKRLTSPLQNETNELLTRTANLSDCKQMTVCYLFDHLRNESIDRYCGVCLASAASDLFKLNTAQLTILAWQRRQKFFHDHIQFSITETNVNGSYWAVLVVYL